MAGWRLVVFGERAAHLFQSTSLGLPGDHFSFYVTEKCVETKNGAILPLQENSAVVNRSLDNAQLMVLTAPNGHSIPEGNHARKSLFTFLPAMAIDSNLSFLPRP